MAATTQAKSIAPTVLVVDDSNLCRELVVEALRGHGYTTLSANDGEMGIGQLQKHRVDAVILDSEMPKMVPSTDARSTQETPDGITEIGHPVSIARVAQFISGVKRAEHA